MHNIIYLRSTEYNSSLVVVLPNTKITILSEKSLIFWEKHFPLTNGNELYLDNMAVDLSELAMYHTLLKLLDDDPELVDALWKHNPYNIKTLLIIMACIFSIAILCYIKG